MTEQRRRTAKRVGPAASPTKASAPTDIRSRSKDDDPLGRQVFFSQAPKATARPGTTPGTQISGGHGRIRAECSSCGATTRMTLSDVARAHFPVWAWIPVLRNSHWIRCPACSNRAWIRLTPILGSN
jgi:hypothetical protein